MNSRITDSILEIYNLLAYILQPRITNVMSYLESSIFVVDPNISLMYLVIAVSNTGNDNTNQYNAKC